MTSSSSSPSSSILLPPLHLSTLQQWAKSLPIIESPSSCASPPPLSSSLLSRYPPQYRSDRYTLYSTLLHRLLNSQHTPLSSHYHYNFSPSLPISVVASPGRDRLFMGHSDFNGLSGITLDCGTREEIVCIGQMKIDENIDGDKDESKSINDKNNIKNLQLDPSSPPLNVSLTLLNSSHTSFPPSTLLFSALYEHSITPSSYGRQVYPLDWIGYVSAAITHMLSPRFPQYLSFLNMIKVLSNEGKEWINIVLYVTSEGELSLPHSGGISSSAALTGAISLSLYYLLSHHCLHHTKHNSNIPFIPWSKIDLSHVDYGEYYLGKFAGCNDKLSQLFAKHNTISILSSNPEKYLRPLSFPHQHISILLCSSELPRISLSYQYIKEYFEKLREKHMNTLSSSPPPSSSLLYSPYHISLINQYAQLIMKRFGSASYVRAVEILSDKLSGKEGNDTEWRRVGMTEEEAAMLYMALYRGNTPTLGGGKQSSTTPSPQLREFCTNGYLHTKYFPTNDHQRYALILKSLLLLPVSMKDKTDGITRWVRKAALYGMSEVERGWKFIEGMERINEICRGRQRREGKEEKGEEESQENREEENLKGEDYDKGNTSDSNDSDIPDLVRTLMRYVKYSHDGDKAIFDYRKISPEWLSKQSPSPSPNGIYDGGWELLDGECPFESTEWKENEMVKCSDEYLSKIIKEAELYERNKHKNRNKNKNIPLSESSSFAPSLPPCNLVHLFGSFERGIIDCDEIADSVWHQFQGNAAVRISAAGLSGRVIVYCQREIKEEVREFMKENGYGDCREPTPGEGTQGLGLEG